MKKLAAGLCALLLLLFCSCGNRDGREASSDISRLDYEVETVTHVEVIGDDVVSDTTQGEFHLIETYHFENDILVSIRLEMSGEEENLALRKDSFEKVGYTVVESSAQKVVLDAPQEELEKYKMIDHGRTTKESLAEFLRGE